jgi:hypothetical protein
VAKITEQKTTSVIPRGCAVTDVATPSISATPVANKEYLIKPVTNVAIGASLKRRQQYDASTEKIPLAAVGFQDNDLIGGDGNFGDHEHTVQSRKRKSPSFTTPITIALAVCGPPVAHPPVWFDLDDDWSGSNNNHPNGKFEASNHTPAFQKKPSITTPITVALAAPTNRSSYFGALDAVVKGSDVPLVWFDNDNDWGDYYDTVVGASNDVTHLLPLYTLK